MARVPAHSIRWYAAGVECADPAPGDLLLVDHGTSVDKAIGVGQWLTAHVSDRSLIPNAWARHAALLRLEGAAPIVAEMGPRGHELHPLSKYTHRLYAVVHFDVDDNQRASVLANDDACSSIDYGWLQYVPLTIDGLTRAQLAGGWGGGMICSTHALMCLMGCGMFPDRNPAAVIPAHLARYVDARPPATLVR